MQTSATKPTLHSAAPRRARFVVLAGVMVSSLFQAGVSYAKLVADPTDEPADITYWLMGSLTGASMRDITMVFPIMLVGCATLFILRWRINILTMGDDEAATMVLSERRLRAFGNPHDVITSELISELSTYCTDVYNKTVTTMENIPEKERVRMAYLLGDDPAWKGIAAIDSGNYYQVPNVPYCWLNNPPTVNQLMGPAVAAAPSVSRCLRRLHRGRDPRVLPYHVQLRPDRRRARRPHQRRHPQGVEDVKDAALGYSIRSPKRRAPDHLSAERPLPLPLPFPFPFPSPFSSSFKKMPLPLRNGRLGMPVGGRNG